MERVSKQAYAIVVYFGMNDKIGNVSYYDSSGQGEYTFQKPYSDDTAKLIDEEIQKLIETAYQRAKKIIEDNRKNMETLANMLLEKEVIFREDVKTIFGERPFEDEKSESIIENNLNTVELDNKSDDKSSNLKTI